MPRGNKGREMDIAKDLVITAEDLNSIKFWLMQEMKKLETERDEFETEEIEFEIEKDEFKQQVEEFEAEKKSFEEEKKELLESLKNREAQADLDKKTLAYEKSLMEKKFAILQNGFDELNKDRRDFERAKEEFDAQKASYAGRSLHNGKNAYDDSSLLFHGVDNLLALKKRYKDLVKIYHPDNLAGDVEAVQIINEEYQMLREAL